MKLDIKNKASRDSFALDIVTHQLNPSLDAKGDLPELWKRLYSIHRNEKGSSGQQNIAPNYKPWHVPFSQPRISIIAGALYQRFTAVYPYIQFIPSDQAALPLSTEMENAVQAVLERGDMDTQLPLGIETAGICGVTLFRLYPDKEKGFCVEAVHPAEAMVYPATVRKVTDAKTVGHKFYLRVSQIKAKIASGEYLECDLPTGKPIENEDIPASPIIAKSQPELATSLTEDTPVECWELLTRDDLGEGEGLYRVVVTRDVPRLLAVEKLEYSRPWYFEGRLHMEWSGFWPEGSIAQNLQGMQHLYTDLHNALVAGSFSAMSPRIVLSGGTIGEKVFQMGFGDVYQANGVVDVTIIPSSFNPGVLPQMIQEVDAKGDAIARVSRVSQNRQLKSRTTKAEAVMLQSQGEDSIEQYAAHFSRPLREMAEFVRECMRLHPDFFMAHYPDVKVTPESVDASMRAEVTGRTAENTPEILSQKLEMAMQTAGMVNQAKMALGMPPVYDEELIGDLILESTRIPTSVDKLKYPKQDGQMGPAGQQPPAMGGSMGVPGMDGGGEVPQEEEGAVFGPVGEFGPEGTPY